MTAVTLRRLMSGDYQVMRGEQRWTPPVLVRRSFDGGWSVTHRGIGKTGFRTQRDVRRWLNSPDGAKWLDSLKEDA